MRILLDTNILTDIAFKREGSDASNKIISQCCNFEYTAFITWHSLSVFHYLCLRRLKDGDKVARASLEHLLDYIEISNVDTLLAKQALKLKMRDFEDSLQAVCAIKCSCDYIVTRNVKDFKNSPVSAILPEDLMSV